MEMTKPKPGDEYCKFTNPITIVLNIISDEISKITESGDLELNIRSGGTSGRWSDAIRKLTFLRQMSSDLHKFYDGQF